MSEDEGVNLGPGKLFAADPAADTWKPPGIVTDGWTMYPDTPEPAEAPEWLQSAIDRASQDRTPVLETTIGLGDSWIRFKDALAKATEDFAAAVTKVGASFKHAEWKHEMLEQIYGTLTQQPRRVALMGTGYRRHASPGKRRSGETRAAHTRRRQLYTERLQRDRRRVRAGRAPILRSSAFQALIPHAQLDARKAGPEAAGMEVVISAMVPDDQVYIVDPTILDQFVQPFELEPPKLYDRGDAWADMQRMRTILGLGPGSSLTGRTHRATNYFTQLMNAYDDERPWLKDGHRPSRIWVDDVEVDVDTWMNEGGADRG